MLDGEKKYLSDLCNPNKQVWNPFGEYSDIGVDKRTEKKDSLTRFIDSCSSNVRGQEVIDSRTGKYVRYSSNCGYAKKHNEPGTQSQDADAPSENFEL